MPFPHACSPMMFARSKAAVKRFFLPARQCQSPPCHASPQQTKAAPNVCHVCNLASTTGDLKSRDTLMRHACWRAAGPRRPGRASPARRATAPVPRQRCTSWAARAPRSRQSAQQAHMTFSFLVVGLHDVGQFILETVTTIRSATCSPSRATCGAPSSWHNTNTLQVEYTARHGVLN